MKERGDVVCGRGQGEGPLKKGAAVCFQLFGDKENHHNTGMQLNILVA